MDYSKKLPLNLYEWTLREMKKTRSKSYMRLLSDMVSVNKDLFSENELVDLRFAYKNNPISSNCN